MEIIIHGHHHHESKIADRLYVVVFETAKADEKHILSKAGNVQFLGRTPTGSTIWAAPKFDFEWLASGDLHTPSAFIVDVNLEIKDGEIVSKNKPADERLIAEYI